VDMRIVITGDRFLTCTALATKILRRLVARYGADTDITIVHGGGPGVDESFARACRQLGLAVESSPADWSGGTGCSTRNERMIAAGADMCIAVHHALATSERTKDCARRAIAAGIPTFLIDEDVRAFPKRLHEGDWRLK
jgi:hypothetical protein